MFQISFGGGVESGDDLLIFHPRLAWRMVPPIYLCNCLTKLFFSSCSDRWCKPTGSGHRSGCGESSPESPASDSREGVLVQRPPGTAMHGPVFLLRGQVWPVRHTVPHPGHEVHRTAAEHPSQ